MGQAAGNPYFLIRVQAQADGYPYLSDVSAFLGDLNQAYEVSRIATDENYSSPTIAGPWTLTEIQDQDRLQVVTLHEGSPLLLLAIAAATPAAVGAIWGLVQIVDKIVNWPINRQILKLQRDKLLNDLRQANLPIQQVEAPEAFRQKLRNREATHIFDELAGRLGAARIRMTDFEISLHNDFPQNPTPGTVPPIQP